MQIDETLAKSKENNIRFTKQNTILQIFYTLLKKKKRWLQKRVHIYIISL